MLNIADLYVFFILRTSTDKTTAVYTRSWVQVFSEDSYTVDGSKILRSPVDVGSLSHIFTSFFTSQVVQDFWIINSIKGLEEKRHFAAPLHEFLLKSSQKVGLWRSCLNARDRAWRLILMGPPRYQTSSRHSLQDHPKARDRLGLLHHQKKFSSLLAALHKKRLNFPWSFGMKTHLLSYALFCAKQLLLWETLGDVVRQRSNLRAIKDMNVLCVWGTFWLNVIFLSTEAEALNIFGVPVRTWKNVFFSLHNSYV